MSKKIYLAGPISINPTGYKQAFADGKEWLKDMYGEDIEIFNPAEEPELSYRECMKADLNYILDKATTIAMLPGWEYSPGAQAEWALARCLKLEIIYI